GSGLCACARVEAAAPTRAMRTAQTNARFRFITFTHSPAVLAPGSTRRGLAHATVLQSASFRPKASALDSFVGRRSEQGGEWPEWRQRHVFVIDEVRLSQRQTPHDGLGVGHGGRWEDEHDAFTVAPLEPLPKLAIKVETNRGADL